MKAHAVVILCLVLAAYSLWLAAAPVITRVFGRVEVPTGEFDLEQGATLALEGDLGPVLDFAPFGFAEGQDLAVTPDGVQTDFVLLGITTGQTEDAARAIISGGNVLPANYAIGAEIASDVVLTGIFADHVVLSVEGQEIVLKFPQDETTDSSTMFVASTNAEPDRKAPDHDALLAHYRAEILQDAPGLLQRLGLEVTDQGYRVTEAASREILQAGLQPGDLIGTVNGKHLGDLATDPALFDEVAALGSANLEVMRDGEAILMTFPLK